MTNYAIILGVHQYDNLKPLPSCERDATFMHGLLRATGKYEILFLPGNVTKQDALKRITAFLPKKPGQAGEILFYYSGHGHQDQDMHFSLKNTDTWKLSKTTLSNSEIDLAVRKAQPKLFVKLIDSCHSGLTYIKGVKAPSYGEIPKASGFENCIFMSSSKKDEFSYATDKYGFFTKAIVDSVKDSRSDTVHYSDVQRYLAQRFKGNERQTPYFMTQCDGTEVFCQRNSAVLVFLQTYHFGAQPGQTPTTPPNPQKPPKPQPQKPPRQEPPNPADKLSPFQYLTYCRQKLQTSAMTPAARETQAMEFHAKGNQCFQDGKTAESIAFFRKALTLTPDNHLLWVTLGRSYRVDGNLNAAREAYNVALSLHSGSLDAIGNLAVLEMACENYHAAYAHCKYLSFHLHELPQDDQARNTANFAIIAAKTGRKEEALALLEKARKLGYTRCATVQQLIAEQA